MNASTVHTVLAHHTKVRCRGCASPLGCRPLEGQGAFVQVLNIYLAFTEQRLFT